MQFHLCVDILHHQFHLMLAHLLVLAFSSPSFRLIDGNKFTENCCSIVFFLLLFSHFVLVFGHIFQLLFGRCISWSNKKKMQTKTQRPSAEWRISYFSFSPLISFLKKKKEIIIYLHSFQFTYILLVFFSLFRADLQEIRKILDTETSSDACPSCHMPFDKGKKRKLIDNCGHGRCYSCMFKSEECPLCKPNEFIGTNGKLPSLSAHENWNLFWYFFSGSRWKCFPRILLIEQLSQRSMSGIKERKNTKLWKPFYMLWTNGHKQIKIHANFSAVAKRKKKTKQEDIC